MMTPYELTVLVHHFVSPAPFVGCDAPAYSDAVSMLFRCGLIDRVDYPRVTPKGECFIRSVLATPLPECVWRGANETEVIA